MNLKTPQIVVNRTKTLRSADGGRKVERKAERSDSRNGAGAKRRPPFTDGSVPLVRLCKFEAATNTRFAQRNGRGREGERADRKPENRANRVLVATGYRFAIKYR
jgi:hypothetical protein